MNIKTELENKKTTEIQYKKKRGYLLRITGIDNKMGEFDFLHMPALFFLCTL